MVFLVGRHPLTMTIHTQIPTIMARKIAQTSNGATIMLANSTTPAASPGFLSQPIKRQVAQAVENSMEAMLMAFMSETKTQYQTQGAAIKNLEN